jgi:Ribbon-helix-helix protein, copG family
MRTTLTLEPAVAERINRIVHSRGRSMKDVVNEALREGLKAIEASSAGAPTHFVVEAHDFGVRPGIDLDTIGRLADDLEDQAIAARSRNSDRV